MWPTEVMEKRLALIGEMRAKWRAIALSTRPLEGHRVEQAVFRAYDTVGLPLTKTIHFTESPRQGAKLAAKLGETLAAEFLDSTLGERRFGIVSVSDDALGISGLFTDLEAMTEHLCLMLQQALGTTWRDFWRWRMTRSVCTGQFDVGRLCYEDYKQATARGSAYPFLGLMAMAQECGWWWPYPDACIVSAKPTRIALDSDDRLHNPYGPAMLYPDGFSIWALHGVLMEKRTIANLDRLNARQIEQTWNVEQRRALIKYYGEERYLLESGARVVHQDDFGTLYEKRDAGDEPLVMVKVVNATPEPDNTYKDYFLRVPPTVRTAREAVAWTFDLDTKTYAPGVET